MEDLTEEQYQKRYAMLTKKPIVPGTPDVGNPQNITAEKLQRFLPKGAKKKPITEKVIHMIQHMEDDIGIAQEAMEESVMTNLHHLSEFGISMEQYVSAVKYCNLKLHYPSNKAWALTFPNRYKLVCDKAKAEGKDPIIENHAASYDRGKLVTAITADMIIQFSIQYAPARHKAMRKLIDLMDGKAAYEEQTVSPKVQMDSAIAVLDKTELPEDNIVQVKIGMDDEAKGIQNNLAAQMAKNAEIQLKMIEQGISLDEVQKLGLVNSDNTIEAEIE